MKKKIKYSNEPLGRLKIVDDFLPPPENLVLKDEAVKVTLQLSKESVYFFKRIAKNKHVPYQKMIRNLLDVYVTRYS